MDSGPGSGKATVGGVLTGVGLGGFIDGILLHQILQWHNMLSSVLPPTTMEAMKTNMLADGLFHAAVWVATFVGILLLWSAAAQLRVIPHIRWLLGLMLIGWGLFNFVEGLIDHQLLGIHHVRRWEPDTAWDAGFLMSGPALAVIGWLLMRFGEAARANPVTTTPALTNRRRTER